MHGLIGQQGIVPTWEYLRELSGYFGTVQKIWYAPSLFWINSTDIAVTAAVAIELVASVLLILNVAPCAMILICEILFFSFISPLQNFLRINSTECCGRQALSPFSSRRGEFDRAWRS